MTGRARGFTLTYPYATPFRTKLQVEIGYHYQILYKDTLMVLGKDDKYVRHKAKMFSWHEEQFCLVHSSGDKPYLIREDKQIYYGLENEDYYWGKLFLSPSKDKLAVERISPRNSELGDTIIYNFTDPLKYPYRRIRHYVDSYSKTYDFIKWNEDGTYNLQETTFEIGEDGRNYYRVDSTVVTR